MAACTLSTILHILWYLCTLFTKDTSPEYYAYSSRHPPYSDVWCTKQLTQTTTLLSCQFTTWHFQISFALFLGICVPSGSNILCKIVKVLANFIECLISLPEKPENFQHLLLDIRLVHSKELINSLHVIAPAVLPVPVALVSCNFLVLLLLCIPWPAAMPSTNSSPLVHPCTQI